jgi:DNA-directed RNA polymerase subunit RPC12/RpoP
MKYENQYSVCLTCGAECWRRVPLDEGSDTQIADDECPRCSSHDVRPAATGDAV